MFDKRSTTAQMHMYLLSPFRIERKDHAIHLPTRKTESLLAYLVLHPDSHSREKLATLFWGDSSDTAARGSLRKAINFIRSYLGNEIIISNRELVQRNPDYLLYCDAIKFAGHASEFLSSQNPDISLIDLDLYQDELLSGFYDEWILDEREYYHQLYIKVLLRAIEVLRAQSEYNTAIKYAQRLLIRDSTNEKAHQHLIFCHVALGDRHGALQQYEACRKVLETELGVKPARETRALYEWITQSSDIRSLAARVTNLPIPISSFVGRGRELAEIKQLVSHEKIVTMTGVGGSGKTRLAIRVATELLDSFHDGVWWVDFSSLSSPALVPQSVAKCLGIIESPEQALIDSVIAVIQEKEMLLVLDNCEHLVEACAQLVNRLLTQCPHLKVLTTSREALRVDGEVVFSIPTLLVPNIDRTSIAELLIDYESVKLFVTRARAVQNNFVVDDRTAVFIAQICARLDGIPLAIELAAARVKTMSVKRITANLDDVFGLLTGRSRTALPRQQTLRALIDWSYDLLSEEEQQVFRCLSVFAGGWTLEAAESVCAGNSLESDQILDLLLHLVDKSLVVAETQGTESRYHMLETIRQYAREKLWAAGEGDLMRQRHLAYFVDLAERAEPNLRSFDMVMWVDRLEAELDNIRVALGWAQESDIEAQLRLASSLFWFWHIRDHKKEGADWLEQGLSSEEIQRGDQSLTSTHAMIRGKALNVAGFLRLMLSETNKAEVLSEESLILFQGLGTLGRQGMAYALLNFSGVANSQLDLRRQKILLGESLTLFQEMGDKFGVAQCLDGLAYCARNEDDYEQARILLDELLALRQEIGDKDGQAFAFHSLGNLSSQHGDYAQATTYYEASLALYREVGNRWATGGVFASLAHVASAQGAYGRAITMLEESLALGQASGEKFAVASRLSQVGFIAQSQGDYRRATKAQEEALTIFRELGSQVHVSRTLCYLGLAALDETHYQPAMDKFGEALAISKEMGNRYITAFANYCMARVAHAQGDLATARELNLKAIAISQECDPADVFEGVARSLESLAILAATQNQMKRATCLFSASEKLYAPLRFEMPAKERAEHDQAIAAARAALGDEVFAVAWVEGRTMDMKQAVEYALVKTLPLH
jgi:predicted ATPase/DNA-binding SARP family transcriptional activator